MDRPDQASPSAIEEYLQNARAHIERLTPSEALAAQRSGALIVDIRPEEQRRRDGALEGAVVIDRNVLEWRLAPSSQWRISEVEDPGRQVVLICNQGFQSSLAAAALRQLGLANTCDVIGGVEGWLAAGLRTVVAKDQSDPGHAPSIDSPP